MFCQTTDHDSDSWGNLFKQEPDSECSVHRRNFILKYKNENEKKKSAVVLNKASRMTRFL